MKYPPMFTNFYVVGEISLERADLPSSPLIGSAGYLKLPRPLFLGVQRCMIVRGGLRAPSPGYFRMGET